MRKRTRTPGIYRRTKADGSRSYDAVLRIDGKKVFRAFPTETAAKKYITATRSAMDRGTYVAPTQETLAEYLDRWLAHQAARLRPRTHERYAALIRIHVVPRAGKVKIPSLRPAHVQGVLDAMLTGGSAPRTVVQTYRVLSAALRQATRWGELAVNPASAVSPPRPDRPLLNIPDPETMRTIGRQVRGTRFEGPVLLAMATGMRLGEILGLRWRDVDLEAELVRVCKAVEWTGRQYRLTDPKTPRGRRTIHLAPSAAEALRRVRKSQAERRLAAGEGWSDEDFVFDAGDGRPMRTDVVSSAFRALVKDAHLPRVRFHDLRHGFATQLLASGVHPKVVSEALGHASVSLTLDVYSHVLPSMGAQTARAIEAALGTVISAP